VKNILGLIFFHVFFHHIKFDVNRGKQITQVFISCDRLKKLDLKCTSVVLNKIEYKLLKILFGQTTFFSTIKKAKRTKSFHFHTAQTLVSCCHKNACGCNILAPNVAHVC